MILVVLENQRGKIHPFSIEALVAGQKFAKNLNCDLAVLCIGEKVEELKSKHPSIGDFRNTGLLGCIELVKVIFGTLGMGYLGTKYKKKNLYENK